MRFGVFYQVTRARRRGGAWLRNLAGQAGRPRPAVQSARDSLRARGQVGLRRLLDRTSDERLEQIFGSSQAQRAVFGMMTRHFDPAKADGFDGAIVYDLGLADGTRRCWVVEVHDGRARVYQDGSAPAPASEASSPESGAPTEYGASEASGASSPESGAVPESSDTSDSGAVPESSASSASSETWESGAVPESSESSETPESPADSASSANASSSADAAYPADSASSADASSSADAASPVEALLTVRVPLADFVRAVTTSESLNRLMFDGRMTMDGDLALADRLPEMFGASSAR